MGGSEDKGPDAPAWQTAQQSPKTDDAQAKVEADLDKPQTTTLEQARKFLQDALVQSETTERKAAFLKSKGIPQSDIDELLRDVAPVAQPEAAQAVVQHTEPPAKNITDSLPSQTIFDTTSSSTIKDDRPPIVTYPEFLTKPTRPPPLVTVNRFLNTLYAFGGISALVYGTSKFVVEPMVDALTEARISLHSDANESLAKLVDKLENTVSELPPSTAANKKGSSSTHPDDEDDAATTSSYDDPTELFHRDIGVQTSLPASPSMGYSSNTPNPNTPAEKPSATQARKLAELSTAVKGLRDSLVSQTEDLGDIKTVLDLFKDDLDTMTSAHMDYGAGFSIYGGGNRNEPDDEIKKAKENIRRVKGVLLSTRSFPASVR
ncbi:peroxisomal membrane anchor protein conserved region-domain-containing protein [Cercophora scortea]|uniref:Peroxisomal membrane protein PEX14 n=1 Tax=Cercophora scortea TaxID=314031 RepID=A0AAE0IAA9_9PEZI|nr:peroxisomal membrane anchor protein conserved region-domain-containing protein [Cercophora scortea]